MAKEDTELDLRSRWKYLYGEYLPALAKARDSAQPRWPVHLDHCFARIILDAVIGEGARPWTEVIGKPAVEKMSDAQLQDVITLAERIAEGKEDLVALDEQSLRARGKRSKVADKTNDRTAAKRARVDQDDNESTAAKNGENKRRRSDNPDSAMRGKKNKTGKSDHNNGKKTASQAVVSSYFAKSPPPPTSKTAKEETSIQAPFLSTRSTSLHPDIASHLSRIDAHPSLTSFRKRVLRLLCQVPRGHWTTYGAMSAYINSSNDPTGPKGNTCARAIGSAMKNNPFAPEVPCHRVLAADGALGGFGGSWGEAGTYAKEKRRLLAEEGVRFDGRDKAMGRPWNGWVE